MDSELHFVERVCVAIMLSFLPVEDIDIDVVVGGGNSETLVTAAGFPIQSAWGSSSQAKTFPEQTTTLEKHL